VPDGTNLTVHNAQEGTAVNPTIDSLLAQAEVEKEAAEHRRQRARAEITYIINAANSEGRSQLSPEEEQKASDARKARDQARKDIAGIEGKIANLRDLQAEESEYASAQQRTQAAGQPIATERGGDPGRAGGGDAPHSTGGQGGQRAPAYDQVHRVGAEARTYTRGSDPNGRQFLMDVCRAHILSDPAAQARLSRHMAEERVERTAEQMQRAAGDSTTGNWAGLTVPQYLTDMYAPVARALRPFADICNKHPLPANGMALDISRITTGTAVTQQVNELDNAFQQSADDTLLTVPVLTAAGQQKVSRQAIDRGTGIEDVLMQDLFAAYATSLDNQLITTASTGLSAVANTVTANTTTNQVQSAYSKILGAMSGVEAALLNMGYPTHAVMHSRRWYWFASQQVSTFPFVQQPGMPFNATGAAEPASHYNSGVRGHLPIGLEVVVDNNLATNLGAGTNQDEIYVVPDRECHLWEDPSAPLYIRADQPAAPSLGVLLVTYGYFAFTFARYSGAIQKVSGTALSVPVF
jgi:hypothetical protein